MYDRVFATRQRVESLFDDVLARLRQNLYRDVVGDHIPLDQLAQKFVFRLARRGESDLNLLESYLAQKGEELQFLFKAHRHDQRLIAVAKIDAAPYRRLVDAVLFDPIHTRIWGHEITFGILLPILHVLTSRKTKSRRRQETKPRPWYHSFSFSGNNSSRRTSTAVTG